MKLEGSLEQAEVNVWAPKEGGDVFLDLMAPDGSSGLTIKLTRQEAEAVTRELSNILDAGRGKG